MDKRAVFDIRPSSGRDSVSSSSLLDNILLKVLQIFAWLPLPLGSDSRATQYCFIPGQNSPGHPKQPADDMACSCGSQRTNAVSMGTLKCVDVRCPLHTACGG